MGSVLITGASSGIGLATAIALAEAGHIVYATMRNPDRDTKLRGVIEEKKLPISILAMDVDSDDSVDRAISAIRSQGGEIEVLVNNAGIERAGSVEDLSFDDFRATMETNYFGSLRCIRAVLPAMRDKREGHIINISSIAARITCSPLAAYSASKAALEALSEALAQEMKPFNVHVAIVEPGIIDTAMARRIETPLTNSRYAQSRRFAGLFQAALANPVPPALVAERIRDIIESETWQLRHLVGPDAEPFIGWRFSMTDEDWVEWGALEDDEWYARVQSDFGLDARPAARKSSTPHN
jgi:NAD(P)-dependent dehydrogenase (short-subunit alcohol dehydrogenase family)